MNVFVRFFNKIFKCYNIYSLDVREDSLLLNKKFIDKRYEVKVLNLKDIYYFDQVGQYRKDYKDIAIDRFSDESFICFGLIDTKNNKLAYFNWLKRKKHYLHEINKTLNFNSTEAMLLDDYTMPEYRGNGLHSYMVNERLTYCHENNIKKVYILIICFHTKAINTVKKYNIKTENSFFSLRI